MAVKSGYLHSVLDPKLLPKTARVATKFLKTKKDSFDAIAIRGVSGVMLGAILSVRLNKPLLVVRKAEQSHSNYDVEGEKDFGRYIIVDDTICSGHTVNTIVDNIKDFNEKGRLEGILLYNDCGQSDWHNFKRIRDKVGYDFWSYSYLNGKESNANYGIVNQGLASS
jgi:orotate phosphoribosyltransferase